MSVSHAICNTGWMPVRAENSHRSEMVTSVLFGEMFRVQETKNAWHRIKLDIDGYEGWVENGAICLMADDHYRQLKQQQPCYTLDPVVHLGNSSRHIRVFFGSSIYLSGERHCKVGDEEFAFFGKVHKPETPTVSFLVELAHQFLEVPYLWGGRTITGTDCSGFIQTIFRIAGINLPRDANQQAEKGEAVEWPQRKPGDLVFFRNANGRITHTGILGEEDSIVHATSVGGSKVRKDKLSEDGIVHAHTGNRTHEFASLRRMF